MDKRSTTRKRANRYRGRRSYRGLQSRSINKSLNSFLDFIIKHKKTQKKGGKK